ncbi:MAG TPA: NUDIX hydrolase [Actinomycetes bacterium]|nr:NUDIX hydrolase [Actinomycetes bacterium]
MTSTGLAPIRRDSARVVLLDEQQRVLLFHGADPDRPEARFWFTPGGGVDPGESPTECALRELREETGLRGVELGPLVWRRRARFSFCGQTYDQREVYFLVRAPSFTVDTSGFTELERRATSGHRWWTLEAMAAESIVVAPAELPVRLAELLRNGPPATPVNLSGAGQS